METAHTLARPSVRWPTGSDRAATRAQGRRAAPGPRGRATATVAACCPPSPGQRTHHEKEGIR